MDIKINKIQRNFDSTDKSGNTKQYDKYTKVLDKYLSKTTDVVTIEKLKKCILGIDKTLKAECDYLEQAYGDNTFFICYLPSKNCYYIDPDKQPTKGGYYFTLEKIVNKWVLLFNTNDIKAYINLKTKTPTKLDSKFYVAPI